MTAMADAKSSASDKAAAADKAAADAAEADRARAAKAAEDQAKAIEDAKAAEAAQVEEANQAAQEAKDAEPRPSTQAAALAKVLEAYLDTNGREYFDEALELLDARRTDDEHKDAARQRRAASKDRGTAPTGRSTPEKKAG